MKIVIELQYEYDVEVVEQHTQTALDNVKNKREGSERDRCLTSLAGMQEVVGPPVGLPSLAWTTGGTTISCIPAGDRRWSVDRPS